MADTEFASFHPDLAITVVTVLRRHGVDAWPGQSWDDGDVMVHVVAAQREHALQLLARVMDEVNAEHAARRARRGPRGGSGRPGPVLRRLGSPRRNTPPGSPGGAGQDAPLWRRRDLPAPGSPGPSTGARPSAGGWSGRGRGQPAGGGLPADADAWDELDGPPLVLERFRRIALNVVVLLAPLMVISLARPPLPLALTMGILVGGMALIVALRNRQQGGRS